MGKLSLVRELLLFLRQNKKLWLLPLILVLLILSLVLILATTSALSPFIYPV